MKTLLLFAALWCSNAIGAEQLGRLFYSPEQRALLDHARRTMPMQTGEAAAAPSTPDYTLRGVVTRSDGQRSVWLNDRVQYGKNGANAQERNQVQVQLPSGSVKLKVGQSYDPDSGKVVESFRRPQPEPAAPKPATKPPAAKKPLSVPDTREDQRDADKTTP